MASNPGLPCPATRPSQHLEFNLRVGLALRRLNRICASRIGTATGSFGSNPLCFAWVAQVQEHSAGFLLHIDSRPERPCMLYVWKTFMCSRSLPELGATRQKPAVSGLFIKPKTKTPAGLTWQVLDWNQPAIDWYAKMGAKLDAEWINVRLLPPAIFEA